MLHGHALLLLLRVLSGRPALLHVAGAGGSGLGAAGAVHPAGQYIRAVHQGSTSSQQAAVSPGAVM
jgi:hypothetical protein